MLLFLRMFFVLALASLSLFSLPLLADTWRSFAPLQAVLAGYEPKVSGLTLDLPLVSEDGSSVPLELRFDARLSPGDRLESIQIFATKNPSPKVIDFYFTAPQVQSEVATRIRLNESQAVIALAKSQAGDFWVAERRVRVTVSGCLMTGDAQATTKMHNPRVALPRRIRTGEAFAIRTLIQHPMETGLRKDAAGQLIAKNLVETLQLEIDGAAVFTARFHAGSSANPYVLLHLKLDSKPSRQPFKAVFTWQDIYAKTLGEERLLELGR